MYKSVKNCLILVFLMIMIPILTSCAAAGPGGNQGPSGSNGVPFEYYSSFEHNNHNYKVLIVQDLDYLSLKTDDNSIAHFSYKEYKKQNVASWTINYYEKNQYFIVPKLIETDVINSFYENIKSVLIIYENYLNITFDVYQDETIVEKELTAKNPNECESILVVDLLIPFRLIDENNQTYTIYIPVKTFLGYKNNDVLKLVYDEDNIIETGYHYFIYSQYIIKR